MLLKDVDENQLNPEWWNSRKVLAVGASYELQCNEEKGMFFCPKSFHFICRHAFSCSSLTSFIGCQAKLRCIPLRRVTIVAKRTWILVWIFVIKTSLAFPSSPFGSTLALPSVPLPIPSLFLWHLASKWRIFSAFF